MDFKDANILKNSPIPLYYQLKQILIKKIQNKEVNPGDALPTEQELGTIFGISRTTIRQAINELVMEGYLYKIKNKGTFVAKQKIMQSFMHGIASYNDEIQFQGMIPKTEVLDFSLVDPPQKVIEGLGISKGSKVIRIFRRRYANNEPILVVENYISYRNPDIFNQDFEKNSFYDYLSKDSETEVVRLTRYIEAGIAGKEESELLDISMGYPIQLATSVGFNKDGKPIEYSVLKYRGDKNKFIVELHIKS